MLYHHVIITTFNNNSILNDSDVVLAVAILFSNTGMSTMINQTLTTMAYGNIVGDNDAGVATYWLHIPSPTTVNNRW